MTATNFLGLLLKIAKLAAVLGKIEYKRYKPAADKKKKLPQRKKGKGNRMNTFFKIILTIGAVIGAFLLALAIIDKTAKVSDTEKHRLSRLRSRLYGAARRDPNVTLEGAADTIADYRDEDDDDLLDELLDEAEDAIEDVAETISEAAEDAAEDAAELTEDVLDQILDD